ncbi:bacteriohemerythrin [candidate division KSB1 bacterium]
MPLVWNEKYCTGIDWIDKQHKELFRHIGKLTDSIGKPVGENVMKSAISFLDVHTKKHFKHEEKMMTMKNYPDHMNHKTQHTTFIYNFNELKKKAESSQNVDQLIGVFQRLMIDWWIKHINRSDKVLANFLMNKSQNNS